MLRPRPNCWLVCGVWGGQPQEGGEIGDESDPDENPDADGFDHDTGGGGSKDLPASQDLPSGLDLDDNPAGSLGSKDLAPAKVAKKNSQGGTLGSKDLAPAKVAKKNSQASGGSLDGSKDLPPAKVAKKSQGSPEDKEGR